MMSREEPLGERGMWALFGFPATAALLLLTLLPALRRGARYLGDVPLPWPYYPWSLYVFLTVAVVGRSVLLCWSMQPLGLNQLDRLVFGPYFLVPLGFAIAILALEMGRVLRSDGPTRFAMLMPPAMFFLASIGHEPGDAAYRYLRVLTISSGSFRAFAPVRTDPDPVYNKFLDLFSQRLGADPLFWTLLLATAFYGYAALRGVRWATGGLSLGLAAMSVVATNSLRAGWLSPQAGPLLAPAALQFYLGWRRRSPTSLLFGSVCLAGAIALVAPVPEGLPVGEFRIAIFGNLVALAMLILGAIFRTPMGRVIRAVGVLVAFFLAAIVVHPQKLTELSWTIHVLYPLAVGLLLTAYGYWQRHSLTMIAATILLGYWLFTWGWTAYQYVRTSLKGFDYLASGMACFAIAVLVSLAKAGVLRRWLGERWPWSRRLQPAVVEACRRRSRDSSRRRRRMARSSSDVASAFSRAVERRRAALRGIVRLQPLDDLDAVAVGIADEEPVAAGDRRRLGDGDAAAATMFAGLVHVADSQSEVARADRVGGRFLQEVQLLTAEVEPEGDEVERPRLGDLAEAEHVPVERPTALDVDDQDRDVIDSSDIHASTRPGRRRRDPARSRSAEVEQEAHEERDRDKQADAEDRPIEDPGDRDREQGQRQRDEGGEQADAHAQEVAEERQHVREDDERLEHEVDADRHQDEADEAEDPGERVLFGLRVVEHLGHRDGAGLEPQEFGVRLGLVTRERVSDLLGINADVLRQREDELDALIADLGRTGVAASVEVLAVDLPLLLHLGLGGVEADGGGRKRFRLLDPADEFRRQSESAERHLGRSRLLRRELESAGVLLARILELTAVDRRRRPDLVVNGRP